MGRKVKKLERQILAQQEAEARVAAARQEAEARAAETAAKKAERKAAREQRRAEAKAKWDAMPADQRKKIKIAAGVGGAILVLILAAAGACGGDGASQTAEATEKPEEKKPTPTVVYSMDERCRPATEAELAMIASGLTEASMTLQNGYAIVDDRTLFIGATTVKADGKTANRSDVWVVRGDAPASATGGARNTTSWPKASEAYGIQASDELVKAVDGCVVAATMRATEKPEEKKPEPTKEAPKPPSGVTVTEDPGGWVTATFEVEDRMFGKPVDNAKEKTVEILKWFKKRYPQPLELRVVGTAELIDAYGNTEEEEVYNVLYAPATVEKINADKITPDGTTAVADSTFIHIAIR